MWFHRHPSFGGFPDVPTSENYADRDDLIGLVFICGINSINTAVYLCMYLSFLF